MELERLAQEAGKVHFGRARGLVFRQRRKVLAECKGREFGRRRPLLVAHGVLVLTFYCDYVMKHLISVT